MVDNTTDAELIAERAEAWLCPHGCPSRYGHEGGCPIGDTFPSRTRPQSPGHPADDCPTCTAYSAERVRLIRADPVLTDDERRYELWRQQGIGEPVDRPPRRRDHAPGSAAADMAELERKAKLYDLARDVAMQRCCGDCGGDCDEMYLSSLRAILLAGENQ